MSRLTKKDISDSYDFVYPNGEFVRGIMPNEKVNGDIYINGLNKLGKIEDIEDELGCPLAVVFKAIKYGVRTKFLDKLNIVSLYYNEEYFLVVFNDFGSNVYVKLKDYKKTWWLSSDLEE